MRIVPIQINCILDRAATRSDGSLSLTFSTGEFSAEEMAVLFKLLKINLRALLTPVGEPVEAPVEVKSEIASKTPSQRIRAVLFCLWKYRKPPSQDFESFYVQETNKYIESIKAELPEPGSPPF